MVKLTGPPDALIRNALNGVFRKSASLLKSAAATEPLEFFTPLMVTVRSAALAAVASSSVNRQAGTEELPHRLLPGRFAARIGRPRERAPRVGTQSYQFADDVVRAGTGQGIC